MIVPGNSIFRCGRLLQQGSKSADVIGCQFIRPQPDHPPTSQCGLQVFFEIGGETRAAIVTAVHVDAALDLDERPARQVGEVGTMLRSSVICIPIRLIVTFGLGRLSGGFMGSGGLDSCGAIRLAGCQRTHGAGRPEVEHFGEFHAAFGNGGAGNAVALGNVGHRGPLVGKAAGQRDALGGQTRVVMTDHFGQDPAHNVPDAFVVWLAGGCGLRFRFRFRHERRIIALAHERAIGGVTFGGPIAVAGQIGCG